MVKPKKDDTSPRVPGERPALPAKAHPRAREQRTVPMRTAPMRSEATGSRVAKNKLTGAR